MPTHIVAIVALLMVMGGSAIAVAPDPVTMLDGMPVTIAAPNGVLPLAVHHAGRSTTDAYEAAQDAPEVLSAVPCTCGCAAIGHRNNLDCYIDHVHADGTVFYATHGVYCAVCQAITRDAMAGAEAGMDAAQLHALIVSTYGVTR